MPAKSIDIVRRCYQAINGQDVAAMRELVHREFEWFPSAALVEGSEYRGHEGIPKYFDDREEAWSEFLMQPEEFREVGDCVLVLGRMKARGRMSGMAVDSPVAWVWKLRDGKVIRLQTYPDRADAMQVVGLALRAPRKRV